MVGILPSARFEVRGCCERREECDATNPGWELGEWQEMQHGDVPYECHPPSFNSLYQPQFKGQEHRYIDDYRCMFSCWLVG